MMDVDRVAPELRPFLAKLPSINFRNKAIREAVRAGTRLMPAHRVPEVSTSWRRDGEVKVRIYRPAGASVAPGLLWFHGGGFVIGSPKQDDRLCALTAAELGVTVVSARYRLAPESPFPAALDDAVAAWRWLNAHHAELGVDPERVAIAGESAGAGIAACLVQRLRDTAAVQPAAQWLFAPMLDDRTTTRRDLDEVDHVVWNNEANRFGWASYLGQASAQPPPYSVAARRSDLTGLPPTWMCAGDIELFHDEIAAYARDLRGAGVEVTLDVVEGGAHGFENWAAASDLTRALLQRAWTWLRTALDVEERTSRQRG